MQFLVKFHEKSSIKVQDLFTEIKTKLQTLLKSAKQRSADLLRC